jgi:hypothetical protein
MSPAPKPPRILKTYKRQSRGRRWFFVIDYYLGLEDFDVVNLNLLSAGKKVLQPPFGQNGFPIYPENPKIVFGMKGRKKFRDLIPFSAYWIISERLKSLFESIDAGAFAFHACDVKLSDGSDGPPYWFVDVVRVIDAVDEVASAKIVMAGKTGYKTYAICPTTPVYFKLHLIESAHVFRAPHSRGTIFSDHYIRDACQTQKMVGIAFKLCP